MRNHDQKVIDPNKGQCNPSLIGFHLKINLQKAVISPFRTEAMTVLGTDPKKRDPSVIVCY